MDENIHKKKSRVGLYSTLIFHLVVLIVLLIASIGSEMRDESSFVLDFTKQELREKENEQEQFKQKVSEEVDQLLTAARNNSGNVRNVAVDANERLRDDRNANPSKVYDEARELQNKLDAAAQLAKQMDASDADNYAQLDDKKPKEESKTTAYSGPSVISFDLEGRKAQYLPVPAYKGYGSGDVCVKIYVNQKGRVIKAEVIENQSSTDSSLWGFALAAAKRSRFNASTTASEAQSGSILYRFIGQY